MRKNLIAVVAICFLASGTAGCSSFLIGSDEAKGPVGIGTGVDELKRSPCACTEIPMKLPDYVQL